MAFFISDFSNLLIIRSDSLFPKRFENHDSTVNKRVKITNLKEMNKN